MIKQANCFLRPSAGVGKDDFLLKHGMLMFKVREIAVVWLAAIYCPTSSTGLMSSVVSLPVG